MLTIPYMVAFHRLYSPAQEYFVVKTTLSFGLSSQDRTRELKFVSNFQVCEKQL